jgi:hypothetical protein
MGGASGVATTNEEEEEDTPRQRFEVCFSIFRVIHEVG